VTLALQKVFYRNHRGTTTKTIECGRKELNHLLVERAKFGPRVMVSAEVCFLAYVAVFR